MSTSDSYPVTFKRRSGRIASQSGGQRKKPSHIDLTDDPPTTEPLRVRHSSEAHSTDQNLPRYVSMLPPDHTEETYRLVLESTYKQYCIMRHEDHGHMAITDFLTDVGFKSEEEFLGKMIQLGFIEVDFPVETVDTEKSTKEDNLEQLIRSFKPKIGIAAHIVGNSENLFRSEEHEKEYRKMLKRGVMNPRSVDFELLESINIRLQEKLAKLNLDTFCTDPTPGYEELTAYFYSNMSMHAYDHAQFSLGNINYHLDARILADVLNIERKPFMPIRASERKIVKALCRDKEDSGTLNYSKLSSKYIVLHKIVTSCLRPKAASKTDVSKYEARLMYAIKKGKSFSLPHSILLHMHQVITSEKGQLPYASLITRIFQHLKINIPSSLQKTVVPLMQINRVSLSKMRLPDVTSALRDLPRESGLKSASKGKRKMEDIGSTSKKRLKSIYLRDENSSSDKTARVEAEEDRNEEEEEEVYIEEEVDRDDEREPEFFPSSQITPEMHTGDYQTSDSGGESQKEDGGDHQPRKSLAFAPVSAAEMEEEDTAGTSSEKLIRHNQQQRAEHVDTVQVETGKDDQTAKGRTEASAVPVELPAPHQTPITTLVPSNLQICELLQQVLTKQTEIQQEQTRQAHILTNIQAVLLQTSRSGVDQTTILTAVQKEQITTNTLLNQCIAKTEETSLDLENLRIVKGSHRALFVCTIFCTNFCFITSPFFCDKGGDV